MSKEATVLDQATIDGVQMTAERLPVAVAIGDPLRPDCPLIAANGRFFTLTGYAPHEVIGRNCRFMQQGCDGPENEAARKKIRLALTQMRGVEVVLQNRRRDGEVFDNLLIMHPVDLEHGAAPAFVGSQFRISPRVSEAEITDQANKVRETLSRLNAQRGELRDERYRSLARSAVELVRTWNYRRKGRDI